MLNAGISPWPFYAQDERDAVNDILLSGKVNQWTGTEVKSFEKEFAEYIGTDYAVAVSNGTVALDLILQYCLLGSIDAEVIVTSRTFIASASSIIMAGAKPVFVDVDPKSGNISPEAIRAAITDNTVAIIAVHLAGWPCDMDTIMGIAADHGIYVIEDCAQAHGAIYKGRKVGSIGHAAAWSFCQDKIMSTGGEGGMITTNTSFIWTYCWSKKDHGKSYFDAVVRKDHDPGFRWLHSSIGSNYRMTEIQAAIGRIQLRKLESWVSTRNYIADELNKAAWSLSAVRIEWCDFPDSRHAKYKHYMYVNPEGLNEGWDRERIIKELIAEGVPCYHGSCSEVYLEKAFDGEYKTLPVAKELGETSLMFLVHPTINMMEVHNMTQGLHKVLTAASKSCRE
jgi:dTDP-4-amino-4,6-dideoxygalactose transaminase